MEEQKCDCEGVWPHTRVCVYLSLSVRCDSDTLICIVLDLHFLVELNVNSTLTVILSLRCHAFDQQRNKMGAPFLGMVLSLGVGSVATTSVWHVVWTGGQSNSVGTNSQKPGSGYPTWPTTTRIQDFNWKSGTFAPAEVCNSSLLKMHACMPSKTCQSHSHCSA